MRPRALADLLVASTGSILAATVASCVFDSIAPACQCVAVLDQDRDGCVLPDAGRAGETYWAEDSFYECSEDFVCLEAACRDCDDTEPAVNHEVVEDCANAVDDDCDGAIDESDSDCNQPAGYDDSAYDDDPAGRC